MRLHERAFFALFSKERCLRFETYYNFQKTFWNCCHVRLHERVFFFALFCKKKSRFSWTSNRFFLHIMASAKKKSSHCKGFIFFCLKNLYFFPKAKTWKQNVLKGKGFVFESWSARGPSAPLQPSASVPLQGPAPTNFRKQNLCLSKRFVFKFSPLEKKYKFF